jgi:hypothetical protein
METCHGGLEEEPWLLHSLIALPEPYRLSTPRSPIPRTNCQHIVLIRSHDVGLSELFRFPVRAIPAIFGEDVLPGLEWRLGRRSFLLVLLNTEDRHSRLYSRHPGPQGILGYRPRGVKGEGKKVTAL